MTKLTAILAFGGVMLGVAWALENAWPATPPQPAYADMPELIPLRDFFANAEATWNYKISPDGKRLGWIGSYAGNPTVLFKVLDGEEIHAIRADRPIWDFWWTQDSRRIFFSWDEHGDENWHLLMADTDAPGEPYVDLTPFPGVRAHVLQVFPDDPSHILIRMNRRDPAHYDLYRLNLDTAEPTLLFENPGDVLHWVTSPEGEVLARLRSRSDDGWSVEVRDAETGAWRPTFGGAWNDQLWIVGYPRDAKRVYARSNRGRDRVALVRIDLETGAEEVVYEHPEVDLDGAWTDRGTYEIRSAWGYPGYLDAHYFDAELGKDLGRFRGDEPSIVWLSSWSRNDRVWTVGVSSATEGTSYYLFDRDAKRKTLLSVDDITRHRESFSPMEPVSFPARDGLRLHGYLTIPKGTAGKALPLVLSVHEGPWDRVRWGFDRAVQFLANRGYAVLQVNYRGSWGYGRRFMEAGIGEFGGKMLTDLEDAVAWAVARGVADPKRVAIYGWDYGGYAALEGLARTPALYAAGVAASAPSDWVAALESLPPYWRATYYHHYFGDPADPEQRAVLASRSPIHRAEQIEGPLLLVQGGRDARGMRAQADALVTALDAHGAEVEYLTFPDEGHWLQRWQSHVRFYRALENFLGAHLGGRVSPPDAVEVWLGLQ